MDWKSVHTLSLFLLGFSKCLTASSGINYYVFLTVLFTLIFNVCMEAMCEWIFLKTEILIVLNQVILGNAKPSKEKQDGAAESFKEVPHPSETKLVYLTDADPDDSTFHNESSVAFSRTPTSEESAVFQIDTPIRVKKIRRRFKTIRRINEKSSNGQNSTYSDSDNQLQFLPATDLSSSEESLSSEETRNNPGNTRDSSRSNDRESDSVDHFVPSEDFPKNIASQSRNRFSNSRISLPADNEETRHALDVRPDSSDDTSRSDISRQRFGERKRNPSSFRNLQSDIVSPDARKVTIVKEKTVHSTSSEAAQERVNIEKHPRHNQATNNVNQHQQPRIFPSTQNLGNVQPQNLNNGNQKIVFIEGTRIPGRNYGPEDDTFGFYANANVYKDDGNTPTPSQVQNGKKVKVVRVIKTKHDNQISGQNQLNNHNNGQSLQYFVSEHPNVQQNKGFNQQQHLKNQFKDYEQTSVSKDVPMLPQNKKNQFNPRDINVHNTQIQNIPFSQNLNHDTESPQKHLQSNNNNHNNFFYMNGDQPVMLNINPDPNEIYIDENTGQLMKFIIIEDSNQQLTPHTVGNTLSNEKYPQNIEPQHFSQPEVNTEGQLHHKGIGNPHTVRENFSNKKNSENNVPQHFPQPEVNIGRQLDQKGIDEQQPNSFASFGKQNFDSHVPPNTNVKQQNQQVNIQHVPVSGGSIFHVKLPNNGNSPQRHPFPYRVPQSPKTGQQKVQVIPDLNDNSEEYVLVCDQDSQDYSAEYQSQNLGPEQHRLVIGGNNYQQKSFPDSNQIQAVGHQVPSGVNHNEGQSFQSHIQNGNSDYSLNSGNQAQQFGFKQSNLNNNKGLSNSAISHVSIGGQGHYKGSEFSNAKSSNNFVSLQVNTNSQDHYKGPDFHTNEGVTNIATPHNSIRNQGHYKDSGFSNIKNSNNFVRPEVNTNAQGHYKGSDFHANEGVTNVATPHHNIRNQFHYRGSEVSNSKSSNNFDGPQVNINSQGHYKGSDFHTNEGVRNIATLNGIRNQGHQKGSEIFNNEGVTNFATPHSGIDAQGHYKGSEFSQNKGTANIATHESNTGSQGHFKSSEFSNHEGINNEATPQFRKGFQGHYKGSKFGKNNGIANFSPPQIHQTTQGHYKGNEFTNNKGVTNYATRQINAGINENYEGSQDSNYKGNAKFGNQQIIEETHGHFKGREISNNKGVSNFAVIQENRDYDNYEGEQINAGTQGHYKGSEFSNNKGNGASFETPHINTGGAKFIDNKGVTHIVTPQVFVLDSQNLGKGSEHSKNKDEGNYAILQINVGSQGHHKGSEFNGNKGVTNFGTPQTNIGGQGQYGGSRVLNSKGITDFDTPQNNVAPQGHYKGSEFSTQNQNSELPVYRETVTPPTVENSLFATKGNSKGSFQNQGNYKGGLTNVVNPESYNTELGLLNQQGYRLNNNIQSNGNGFDSGYNAPTLKGNNKGTSSFNEKGHAVNNFGNQEGHTSNTGDFLNNQRQNFRGNAHQHSTDSGITHQKGNKLPFGEISSNIHSSNPQFSGQAEYKTGNEELSNNQAYSSGKQTTNSHSSNGGQGDLVLLIQKGYNAESDVFPPGKAHQLFSSKTPIKSSVFPNQKDYTSGNNKGLTNYQGFSIDKNAESFSGAISSKSLNKGSGYFNNKGPVGNRDSLYRKNSNSGNRVFSINQGYKRNSDAFNNNKGSELSNNKGNEGNFEVPHINAGSAKFVDNKGVTHIVTPQVFILDSQNLGKGSELSNNKGTQKTTNTYAENPRNNFKGIPVQISQNTGYGNQINSVPAFQKNAGPTQYGNQRTLGYGGRSSNIGLKSQQHNIGNNEYGISYSSSEENIQQPNKQYSSEEIFHQPNKQHSSEEEPIQLLLVEEDIPGDKNKNNDGAYYIQYPTSAENSQEQSYLILDDSAVQQHPNLKVMVDGGKDLTYPIRNLAKVGFHMARSVLPQIPEIKKNKRKNKSISGKINFGIEFKKGNDRSDSKEYIQSRIDQDSEEISEENKQNSEVKTEDLESEKRIQSRIDKESDEILGNVGNEQNTKLKTENFQSIKDKDVDQKPLNNQSSHKEEEKSR